MKRGFLLTILWSLIFVPQSESAEFALPVYGFVKYSAGSRAVSSEDTTDELVLNEAVARLELTKVSDIGAFNLKTDFIWDEFLDKAELDIREASLTLFPSDWWELKIGRQILSWGTGDLVFANDLFPKDWKSFYFGKDEEYLNAPVTAVKLDLLAGFGDLTAVVVPKFTPDTYVDGERFSYWGINGLTMDERAVEKPDLALENAEYHVRFTKNLIYKVMELALYSYKGFFKQPQQANPEQETGIFHELAVYGFSIRVPSPVAVFDIESSYHDSLDDRDGTDAMVDNSMVKSIAGCTITLIRNLTIAVQYSFEWMQGYEAYKESIQAIGQPALKKEYQDRMTLRLTNLHKQEQLMLSLFGSYSPAEEDWYLRPDIMYNINAQIQFTLGANLFFGEHDYTSFGQFQENSNVYFRMQYSY